MYDALGITGNTNLLVAGIYNCMGPLASKSLINDLHLHRSTNNMLDLIFIVFMIDRIGRRKPLLWGTIGITIALICEAVVNSQINTEKPQKGLSIAGVFFLFCVTIIFSCKSSSPSFPWAPSKTNLYKFLGDQFLGFICRKSCRCKSEPVETHSPLVSETGWSLHSGLKSRQLLSKN